MRGIGCLVAVCLLVAGAAPKRVVGEHARSGSCDEIAAAKALAKLAVRREGGVRPTGALGLDALALVTADAAPEPPRTCIEIVHAAALVRFVVVETSFDARGPPLG